MRPPRPAPTIASPAGERAWVTYAAGWNTVDLSVAGNTATLSLAAKSGASLLVTVPGEP